MVINEESKAAKEIDKPVESAETGKPIKKLNNTVKLILGAVVVLLVAAVLLIVIVGVGIYKFNWQNQLTDSVLKVIPYPALIMDFKFLSYSDYQEDLTTLKHFYDVQEQADTGLVTRPPDDYLEKSILSRMVREKFTADQAQEFGLTVNQSETDQEYDKLVSQAGSAEEVNQTLREVYDWSADQFKEKVLVPYLYRTKLQQYLADDESMSAEASQKAKEVLAILSSGDKTFEELAQEYSEDTTAASGGDLGFFGRGEMVEEFEEAAFALEPGQTSGVVKTQYGYHIIKLIEKVPASDDSAEQLHAAHILIRSKDIDEWLNEQIAQKAVLVVVAGYEWKKDCGLVLAPSETCEKNDLLDFGAGQTINTNSAVGGE